MNYVIEIECVYLELAIRIKDQKILNVLIHHFYLSINLVHIVNNVEAVYIVMIINIVLKH